MCEKNSKQLFYVFLFDWKFYVHVEMLNLVTT